MIELNPKWTPIKYQFRTDLNAVSVKTKENFVSKSNQAVKRMLEIIAPGQSETLREACLEKTELTSHGDILKCLQAPVTQNHSSNDRVQLASVLCAKDKGNKHIYAHIVELRKLFSDMSKHHIEKARMHAAGGQAGMPIEKYIKKSLTDAQVNHFLEFLQASGTRTVKLTSGRKAILPNFVRTVHKSEIVRLYITPSEEEGYTTSNGRPSFQTKWNMLNNCPSNQHKSLSGLDNVAVEGSDSFDLLLKVTAGLRNSHRDSLNKLEIIEKQLRDGKQYIKSKYEINCSNICNEISDHCRIFALFGPKEKFYQQLCSLQHENYCQNCEALTACLKDLKNLVTNMDISNKKKKEDLLYDIDDASRRIFAWKAHILATVHQEMQKMIILGNLLHNTAFLIVDFAMKFLVRRCRESMPKLFGKAGMGMHIACVIVKDQEENLKKRTYVVFIDNASQNTARVIAIYQ